MAQNWRLIARFNINLFLKYGRRRFRGRKFLMVPQTANLMRPIFWRRPVICCRSRCFDARNKGTVFYQMNNKSQPTSHQLKVIWATVHDDQRSIPQIKYLPLCRNFRMDQSDDKPTFTLILVNVISGVGRCFMSSSFFDTRVSQKMTLKPCPTSKKKYQMEKPNWDQLNIVDVDAEMFVWLSTCLLIHFITYPLPMAA